MDRILITGAAGFIGSHLCEYLSKLGYKIYALSRQIPLPLLQSELEVIRGDISSTEVLRNAVKKVDIIIHAAAILASKSYEKKVFYDINYLSTCKLLEIAKECYIKKFLYISSGGVLGHIEKPPADEKCKYAPEDAYEETKMLSEIKVLEASRNSFDAIILRPTWSYGPRDKRVFKLIKAIYKRRFVKIGRCQNLQHPVYISDLVEGIRLALERGKNNSIYFIGGDEILSTSDIINIISDLLQVKVLPFAIPFFLMNPLAKICDKIYGKLNKEAPFSTTKLGFFLKNRAFSIKKAQEELGYRPEVKFREGMRRTIQWYKENTWLK